MSGFAWGEGGKGAVGQENVNRLAGQASTDNSGILDRLNSGTIKRSDGGASGGMSGDAVKGAGASMLTLIGAISLTDGTPVPSGSLW
ncbi:MAG: hypothetical protein HWE23_07670 [Rhodobacteraceae bacterium]|nr:hypothetical protein [Paracoccaceae bacterium]